MGKKRTNEEKMGLSAVLRRGPINLMAFGYVAASAKCGVAWNEAIKDFVQHFNLEASDVDAETLRKELNRMTVDYLHEGV